MAWTVGELSEATGLSVRVLRHWEAVGLVAPARTSQGHRRYGSAEVTRLYRAMALRRTGLSLRRIVDLLDQQDPDPTSTLRGHLAEIDADLRRRTELRDRLAQALAASGAPGEDPHALMKVIETMTMFEQYVHGYRDEEGLRLHDQARILTDLLHDGLSYPEGSRVLEVGCGVGAQTLVLAERSPGARITSIDLSPESLTLAERRLTAAGHQDCVFLAADVYDLPHADGELVAGGFDHVFVCFVLEHLARPVEALRALGAMLRPGGTLTVIEGDHGSTYFHPGSQAALEAVACQVTLQRLAGGDADIGRRLYPLLVEAGLDDVRAEPRQVYVDASRPDLVDGFTRRTFTAMVAGVREPAVAAGLITPERFEEGLRGLERTTEADGTFCYTFFRATAVRR